MSEKISTGFVFKHRKIDLALRQVNEFRAEVGPAIESWWKKCFSEMFVSSYDNFHFVENIGCDRRKLKFYTAFDFLCQIERRFSRFEIVLFFYRNRIYGMTFGLSKFYSLWMENHFVKDYHYHAFKAAPNGITKIDWDKRGRTWGKIIPFNFDKSQVGFSATCGPARMPAPDKKFIDLTMDDLDFRVERLLYESAYGSRNLTEEYIKESSKRFYEMIESHENKYEMY